MSEPYDHTNQPQRQLHPTTKLLDTLPNSTLHLLPQQPTALSCLHTITALTTLGDQSLHYLPSVSVLLQQAVRRTALSV